MLVVGLEGRGFGLGLEDCVQVAVLGLGLKAKIMSFDNWLNSYLIMICYSSL